MFSWPECFGPAARLSIMVGSMVEDAQIIAVERQRGWEKAGCRVGEKAGRGESTGRFSDYP